MRLNEAQEIEKRKYDALVGGPYGGSCHARPYIAGIVRYGPQTVADFGCGDNEFCKNLRSRGIWALGIDWVDFGNPGADIISPMWKTPIKDHDAGLVTAWDSLEHLTEDMVVPVLKEMRRVSTFEARFMLTICTRKSKITSNGGNLHPTVKPIGWWEAIIRSVFGSNFTSSAANTPKTFLIKGQIE